eukprot:1825489-Pleurochrysis_carterae.AAC.15
MLKNQRQRSREKGSRSKHEQDLGRDLGSMRVGEACEWEKRHRHCMSTENGRMEQPFRSSVRPSIGERISDEPAEAQPKAEAERREGEPVGRFARKARAVRSGRGAAMSAVGARACGVAATGVTASLPVLARANADAHVARGSPCRLRVVGLICVASTRLYTRAACCAKTRVCCLFSGAVVSMPRIPATSLSSSRT